MALAHPTVDARAGRLAARQLGLVTGAQARALGFTDDAIRSRVRAGRWLRPVRGVYLVAGAPVTWQTTLLAACLAGPPGVAASHPSAGSLWRVVEPASLPHVTVPRGASARSPIARVHRSDLQSRDITRIGPIPVTRVPRALVDLASVLTQPALESAVDSALDRGLTAPAEVEAAMARAQSAPGRGGMPALRRALEAWTDAIRPGSPAEARLVRRLADWALPTPARQHVVRDRTGQVIARLDLAWPERMVGLEYDGRRPHGPRRIEPDEHRHTAVEALGWTLHHADRLDLRPGDHRLRDVLRPLLGVRSAA